MRPSSDGPNQRLLNLEYLAGMLLLLTLVVLGRLADPTPDANGSPIPKEVVAPIAGR